MKFKNDIELQAGLEDLSGSTGTSGQLLSSTATGTSWVDQSDISAGNAEHVVIYAKNTHTASIAKGTPVYITGTVGATDTVEIAPADASDSAKMPAVGLLDETLAVNAFGYVITGGFMDNITTDPIDGATPSSNDTVYVKAGGGLTLTKPTGPTGLIQNVAKVGKVSGGNSGSLIVSSILRTNDVPNLTTGKIWVGDGNTVESTVVHLDEVNGRMGIGTTSPNAVLDVSGAGNFSGGTVVSGIDSHTDVGISIAKGSYVKSNDGNYLRNLIGQQSGGDIEIGQGGTGLISNINLKPGSSGNIDFFGSGSVDMRVASSGNVGIGTTSPSNKLHVNSGTINEVAKFESTDGTAYLSIMDSNTTNSLQGIGSAGDELTFYSNNAERMRIDSSGNLGIGTTSPTSGIHVNTSQSAARFISSQGAGLEVQGGGNSQPIASFKDTAASEKVRISSTGNVGVGTTSPTNKLHVYSDANEGIFMQGTGGGHWFNFQSGASNLWSMGAQSGMMGWYNRTTGNVGYKMVIQDTGNVGIGTTSPAYKLDVNGSLHSSNITLADGIYHEGDTNTYINFLTDTIQLATSGSPRLYINSSGNVGIGTTSPSQKLDVNGRVNIGDINYTYGGQNFHIVLAENTQDAYISNIEGYGIMSSGGYYYGASLRQLNSNSTAYSGMQLRTNGDVVFENITGATAGSIVGATQRMIINSSGNVGIGTNNPGGKLTVSANGAEGIEFFPNNFTNGNTIQHYDRTGLAYSSVKTIAGDHRFNIGTSEAMRITSNERVGIGTTSPLAKLDVSGSVNSSGGYSTSNTSRKYFWRTDNTGNSGAIWKKIGTYNSSGQSSRIMITATGTTSYGAGTKSGKMTIIAQVNNNNLLEGSFWQEGMVTQYGSVGFVSNSNTSHDIYYQVSSYAEYAYEAIVSDGTFTADSSTVSTPSFTHQPERSWNVNSNLLVNSAGNVGIGTTSPGYKLDVNGSFQGGSLIADPASMSLTFGGSDVLYGNLSSGALPSKAMFGVADSGIVSDFPSSEAIRIDFNGNVGIGTTGPANKLDVVGISRFTHSTPEPYRGAIETVVDNAYPAWAIGWLHARTGSSTYGNIARFNDQNGSQIGGIFYSGSSGTSFVTTSDYRLKENIKEISDSISRVKKLKPCRFNFSTEKNRVIDGFIAHEVQEVVPEAVHGEKDALQKDGSINAQTLEVSRLIPVLTKALQEAINKIEELELRIQTIENN